MKRILIVISIVLISITGSLSQKVKWYSLQKALDLSEQQPKKIFIDVYTDWCGWCVKMDKGTFEHPVIAEFLNDNFYPVKFNAEGKDTIVFQGKTYMNSGTGRRSTHDLAYALASRNGRIGYPTIVYLNESHELITPWPGYQTPEQIEPILHFISKDIYKRNPNFELYKNNFESNIE